MQNGNVWQHLFGMEFPSTTSTTSLNPKTTNYTDAAPSIGFNDYNGGRWFTSTSSSNLWTQTLHELYPIITAAKLWGHKLSRKFILMHSDNMAVCRNPTQRRPRCLFHFSFHKFILEAPESDIHPTPVPLFSGTVFSSCKSSSVMACGGRFSSHLFRLSAPFIADRPNISNQTIQVLSHWSSQANPIKHPKTS